MSEGRFFPLNYETFLPILYYFPSPLYCQMVRLFFIWLSLIITAWLITLITKNLKVSLLFILLAPSLWSMRYLSHSDPLASYGAELSLLTIFMMLTLCFFIKFVEHKKWAWLLLSILVYCLALMIYEPGIVTFFCIVILAWFYTDTLKKFCVCILPYVLITLIYLAACMVIRHHLNVLYGGVAIAKFDTRGLMTFVYELIAPFPLSYGILHGHFFKIVTFWSFFNVPYLIVCLVVLAPLSYVIFNRLTQNLVLGQKYRRLLIALAIPLCVVPAILIGITAKYQDILGWGLAYLPVYVQYMGATFLLIVLLAPLKRLWRHAAAFIFSLIICLSFIFNWYSVRIENNRFQDPRALEIMALQNGILKNISNNATIMSKDHWTQPAFFLQYGGVHLSTIPLNNGQTITPDQFRQMSRSLFFLWSDNINYSSNGTVLLGKVKNLNFKMVNNSPQLSGIVLDNADIFSSFDHAQALHHLNAPQYIRVDWSCPPHVDIPCFSIDYQTQKSILN